MFALLLMVYLIQDSKGFGFSNVSKVNANSLPCFSSFYVYAQE
jgi:hypothetical protein